eukprot:2379575-Pyramimonas_sp.AAC.1
MGGFQPQHFSGARKKLGRESNSPVARGLDKGLMIAWSPSTTSALEREHPPNSYATRPLPFLSAP